MLCSSSKALIRPVFRVSLFHTSLPVPGGLVPGGLGLKPEILSLLQAPAFGGGLGNWKTSRVQRNKLLAGAFPLDEVQQTWAGLGWVVVTGPCEKDLASRGSSSGTRLAF